MSHIPRKPNQVNWWAVRVTRMSTSRNELEWNPAGWNPRVSVQGLWGIHERTLNDLFVTLLPPGAGHFLISFILTFLLLSVQPSRSDILEWSLILCELLSPVPHVPHNPSASLVPPLLLTSGFISLFFSPLNNY